jgi:hypothetical protein
MLPRLSRTVAFSYATGDGYASQSPRALQPEEKATRGDRRSPSRVGQTQPRKYAPVDLSNYVLLRPATTGEESPGDRTTTVSTPRRQENSTDRLEAHHGSHLVIRPSKRWTDIPSVARPQTSPTPESHSQGESKSFVSILS